MDFVLIYLMAVLFVKFIDKEGHKIKYIDFFQTLYRVILIPERTFLLGNYVRRKDSMEQKESLL